MKLCDVIKDLDILEMSENTDTEINEIIVDSRKSSPGKMFVCIDGFVNDGHRYIGDAVKNGVSALLVAKMPPKDVVGNTPVIRIADTRLGLAKVSSALHHYPTDRLNLIGITGTKGKTSTSYMLRAIYTAWGKSTGLIGTIQNIIGDEILHTDRTTPEANEIQALCEEMLNKNIENCIMEVSSQGLNLNRVACCKFKAAVFTNLSPDHIGPSEHRNMDDYADAKSKLFAMSEIAILNRDNRYWEKMASRATGRVYTFGIESEDVDFKAVNIKKTPVSVEYDLVKKSDSSMLHIFVPVPGKFNVYNSMSAAVTAILLGIPEEKIVLGLSEVFVPGKAETVETGKDFTVIIDYAHNPDSFENIITTVKEFAKRTVFLFGCGGDRNRPRELMGETAGKFADFTIITSDNPRTEDPESIMRDLEKGIKKTNGKYICIVDRGEAIKYAIRNALPGDVIILAGKGHETYQIFKDKTIHFDEREVVREALNDLD